eukprot:1157645-Pelagomonas_calceolata.AAC.5
MAAMERGMRGAGLVHTNTYAGTRKNDQCEGVAKGHWRGRASEGSNDRDACCCHNGAHLEMQGI